MLYIYDQEIISHIRTAGGGGKRHWSRTRYFNILGIWIRPPLREILATALLVHVTVGLYGGVGFEVNESVRGKRHETDEKKKIRHSLRPRTQGTGYF